ncbi:class I SAM-dependent methyltransferase [Streptomyces tsukubensis]|uniref:SAM-dependent methyltransferase n=1 Tax=Streptomyces tsukubensis TaxID=83656 RepID=A0A1V3ZZP3_9ACTN|nr:class I SAM-dependent methyltransferase [Streptomyces tsukubensis]OON71640.1 SAM-dependent methyltransferase [Streptomyces tsukubensis]QFR95091.1 methyltransferase domain-containing protein [Streptomyces tsukubensis]
MTPKHPSPAPSARALSFNAVAASYAAGRPSYPAALFDEIEDAAGRPLDGATVVDVGAGTGIATGLLRARGARVIAIEPGDGMARQFRVGLPDVPLVRGDGNALPLADATADFVTYAQSWHWTAPELAIPEAMRVLRPGGALAAWWNVADRGLPWVAAQDDRLRRAFGADGGAHGAGTPSGPDGGAHGADTPAGPSAGGGPTSRSPRYGSGRDRTLAGRLDTDGRQVRWSRRVPLDTHLRNLASHSVLLIQTEDDRTEFLAEERAALLHDFPEAVVEETYVVDLSVAIRPSTPSASQVSAEE